MKVAFQGERGAYSEEAACGLLGDVAVLPCPRFRDVFEAVLSGQADRGVIPIENSQAGSITDNFDLLLLHPVTVVAEFVLRVRHCLLGLPGQQLQDIKQAHSHPQALMQCETFLRERGINSVAEYDTAGSAKMLAKDQLPGVAAIAGKRAAQIYGLTILAEDIETNPNNQTRFLCISLTTAPVVSSAKTSIILGPRNSPGMLHRAMGSFASRNINVTKLESRPRREGQWDYLFFLDFEGHRDNPQVKSALTEIEKENFLKVLGSYSKISGNPL